MVVALASHRLNANHAELIKHQLKTATFAFLAQQRPKSLHEDANVLPQVKY